MTDPKPAETRFQVRESVGRCPSCNVELLATTSVVGVGAPRFDDDRLAFDKVRREGSWILEHNCTPKVTR